MNVRFPKADIPLLDRAAAIGSTHAARRGRDQADKWGGDPAQIFTPGILAKIPPARWKAFATDIRAKYGRALGVSRIEASSPTEAQVFITFERTEFPIKLGINSASPNLINTIFLTPNG